MKNIISLVTHCTNHAIIQVQSNVLNAQAVENDVLSNQIKSA